MGRRVLLRRHDLRRRHLAAGGQLALEYIGAELPWIARIEGQPLGTIAVVTRDEVAAPPQLEVCAADAGVDLDSHPAMPRLRAVVADALLAGERARARELLEEMTGLRVEWAPGAEHSVRSSHRRALDAVDAVVREVADDLAARARRRRAATIMSGSVRHVSAPLDVAEALGFAPPRFQGTTPPAPVTADLLAALEQDIATARSLDLPQRLPNGVRRSLSHLAPGVYLVEDGLLCPQPNLRSALEQASRTDSRAQDRAVVDWDGEWAVMARRYGPGGAPGYRIDRALQRFVPEPDAPTRAMM
jgi:hypothetical protein